MARRCVYGTCNSNSTYYEKDYMKDVFFVAFPSGKHESGKRQKWIAFCGGNEKTKNSRYYRYLCSRHFVGGNGPFENHPDPIPLESTSPYCKPVTTRTRKDFSGSLFAEMIPITEEIEVMDDPCSVDTSLPDNARGDICFEQNFTDEDPLVYTTQTLTFHQVLDKVQLPPESTVGNMGLQVCVKTFGQVVDVNMLGITNREDLQLHSPTELEEFMRRLNECNTCRGNPEVKYTSYILSNNHPSCIFLTETAAVHSRNCSKICIGSMQCTNCGIVRKSFSNIKRNSGELLLKRMKSTLKATKLRVSDLTRRLNALKKSKREEGPFQKLLKNKSLNKMYPPNSPRRLFLLQQMCAWSKSNATGMRWDTTIIRFFLHFKNKSSSSYKLLRKSGLMSLPSICTLNRYSKNYSREPGFHAEVVNELKEIFEGPKYQEPHCKYVSLIIDEMKIKEDIIYNKQTGELIGFVHLNETYNNIKELGEQSLCEDFDCNDVSKYALQIIVRGCTTGLNFSFAHFFCNVLNSRMLHSILMDALDILEDAGIYVLSIIADGASKNRQVFKIFSPHRSIPYKVVNPFARDESRPLYFISDVCHLIKTVRNNFANSNYHSNTRRLWINGQELLWSDIIKIFREDSENVYRYLQKLTSSHIFLTPGSKMRVRLAAQILSNTVATYLKKNNYASELVRFIQIFNKYFDVLNVRFEEEGRFTRNSDKEAFKHTSDERLSWLKGEFLDYLKTWEDQVACREGPFTKGHREKMLLSSETRLGLRITSNSVPEMVHFLLVKGAKYVLTGHFNQDPLEEDFGMQRQSCGANNHPTAAMYSYNIARLKHLRTFDLKTEFQNVSVL